MYEKESELTDCLLVQPRSKNIFQIDTGEGREREELTSKFKISGSWEQIESSQREKREGMHYW